MTRPRTIYIAPHRTYILDTDGSLLAICAPGPAVTPEVVYTHDFGSLHHVYPNVSQLRGAWLEFANALVTCSLRLGAALVWPGQQVRLRSRTFDAVVRL